MSDFPTFSAATLPQGLLANDLFGCHDEMAVRMTALLSSKPKGKSKKEKSDPDESPLPDGLEPLSAIPDQIERPWKRFVASIDALRSLRHTRASAQADAALTAQDETAQDLANTASDDRWRGFEAWVRAQASLTDDGKSPSPAEAKWLYAQLFPAPDGLRFITWRPRRQWGEMEQRMKVLATERGAAVVQGFGGERHYEQLEEAHKRFGDAFGFSALVKDAEAVETDGRPEWTAARESFRLLLGKIEHYADPDIVGSEAVARFLLAPFHKLAQELEQARKPAKKASAADGKKPVVEGAPPKG